MGQELLKGMQQGLQTSITAPLKQLSRLDSQLEVRFCWSGQYMGAALHDPPPPPSSKTDGQGLLHYCICASVYS